MTISTTARRRQRHRLAATVAVAAALALVHVPSAGAQTPVDPRQGLTPGTQAGDEGTGADFAHPKRDAATAALGMELLAERSKPAYTGVAGSFNQSNINSDLAFSGDYAYSGNYRGFGVYDVSDPAAPELKAVVNCVGGQGDLSVVGNLLFMSVESTAGRVDCADPQSAPFRGVRIFDVSNPLDPRYVTGVQTCRGSHTHTVVEDPDDDENLYVYVSGTAAVRPTAGRTCVNTSGNTAESHLDDAGNPIPTSRFQVEVIRVPLEAPETADVVNEARLMADETSGSPAGLWPGGDHGPGTQSTSASDACHDITAYPAIGLAAGACEGNGILIDISDPANPTRIAEVTDTNFAYWHSATFNNDGTKVVFTDEWGGGGAARCSATYTSRGQTFATPANWGANAIFDLVDGANGPTLQLASYYKVPNVQANNEVCVAHNGNLIPVPGRDIMVQAWYEGGTSVFDFTDSAHPKEIAFFDRGPYHPTFFHAGGYWSTYWYNGAVFGNEIFLGFDSWGLTGTADLSANEIAAAARARVAGLNAQAQEPIVHAPSFEVVRARFDQAVRSGALSGDEAADVQKFVDRAEGFAAKGQKSASATLTAKAGQLTKPAQKPLADELRRLANSL